MIMDLVLNTKTGLEKFKPNRKQVIILLLIMTILSAVMVYLTLSSSTNQIVEQLQNNMKTSVNKATIQSFVTIISVATGVVFPVLTIAFNALLFFLATKFFSINLKYKTLFSLFTYLYPLTLISNIINFILKYFFDISNNVRITSLNGFFYLDGKLGILLNSIDIFQIWSLIIVYFALIKLGGMEKSSSFTIIFTYFLIVSVTSILF